MDSIEIHFGKNKRKNYSYYLLSLKPESGEESLGELYFSFLSKSKTAKKDLKLAKKMVSKITSYYYEKEFWLNPNDLLKKSLDKANNLLSGNENNFNMAVLSTRKNLFNFSCFGEGLKSFIFKEKNIYKLGGNNYFNNNFSEIISGKLNPGDKIIILPENIFDWVNKNKLLKKIAEAKKAKEAIKIINSKKQEAKKLNGFILLIQAKETVKRKKKLKLKLKKIKLDFLWEIMPNDIRKNKRIKKGIISALIIILLLFIGYFLF